MLPKLAVLQATIGRAVPGRPFRSLAAGRRSAPFGAEPLLRQWFWDVFGREALTSAALLLGATQRMVIASGIANIWARDPVAPGDTG